jgi:hypothetical protein
MEQTSSSLPLPPRLPRTHYKIQKEQTGGPNLYFLVQRLPPRVPPRSHFQDHQTHLPGFHPVPGPPHQVHSLDEKEPRRDLPHMVRTHSGAFAYLMQLSECRRDGHFDVLFWNYIDVIFRSVIYQYTSKSKKIRWTH